MIFHPIADYLLVSELIWPIIKLGVMVARYSQIDYRNMPKNISTLGSYIDDKDFSALMGKSKLRIWRYCLQHIFPDRYSLFNAVLH